MARTKNSAVMVIANRLVKEGYSRSTAMVKAWILVKLPALLVMCGWPSGQANPAIRGSLGCGSTRRAEV